MLTPNFTSTHKQALENKEKEATDLTELRSLHDLFLSQQRELHDMRNRLAAFMTKGAPLYLIKEETERLIREPEERRKKIAEVKRRVTSSSSLSSSSASVERLMVGKEGVTSSTPRPPHQPRPAVAIKENDASAQGAKTEELKIDISKLC